MTTILMKLVNGATVTDEDLKEDLLEICYREHASCNSDCPVYAKNGDSPVNPETSESGCDTFKRGDLMLAFLRK